MNGLINIIVAIATLAAFTWVIVYYGNVGFGI